MKQGDISVSIVCQDNTTYQGDILVGADGAYSAVRQCLFEQMKKDKLLPKDDQGVLPYSCVCLVGQTDPLDPELFPELLEPIAKFSAIKSATQPYSVSLSTRKRNDMVHKKSKAIHRGTFFCLCSGTRLQSGATVTAGV